MFDVVLNGEQGKYLRIWHGREARLWSGAGGCLCFVKPSFVCARCKWNDMTVRRRFLCCLSTHPLRIRAQPPRTRRVVLGDRPIPFLRLSACWQVRGIGTRRTCGLGWGGCLCFCYPPPPLPVYLHIKWHDRWAWLFELFVHFLMSHTARPPWGDLYRGLPPSPLFKHSACAERRGRAC
jgi:hypothetical protein